MKTESNTGGPPQQYPELGGRMKPVTVFLPPDVIDWAEKHPRGISEVVRTAVVNVYKRLKSRK